MSPQKGKSIQPAVGFSPLGRQRELQILENCLEPGSPGVIHLHGIAGIGKSHLLDLFASRAASIGAVVLRLDCGSIEPTSRGFLNRLGLLLGSRSRSAEKLAAGLGRAGERVVLILDGYELLRLLDTWLRRELLTAFPENVCVVISSRLAPTTGWLGGEELRGRVRSLPLGPLDEPDSLDLLSRAGIGSEAAKRVLHFTHGHPLALQLAIAAIQDRPGLRFEGLAIQGVIEELTRMFLADVEDATTRQLLMGAAVLRRVTIPLLATLFPELSPQESYDRLLALPFTDSTQEGLMLHEAVRGALARSLRARDPATCLKYRRAAWTRLSQDLSLAADAELWRYTADVLYLIDNPVVREAFFPTGESWLQVEPAGHQDRTVIREMISRFEKPAAAADMLRLQKGVPTAFSVVRGENLDCLGFYVAFDPAEVERGELERDPVSSSWLDHLRANPLPEGQRALFCRRWLSGDEGEAPSEVQAACWLDIKRTYLEMRPRLQRVYLGLRDPSPYEQVAGELGFALLPEIRVECDGAAIHGAVLEFGSGSVDGWLANLLASEVGVVAEIPRLDSEARELIVDGNRLSLTKLEFGVISYLFERPGKAVSRTALLNDVWDMSYEGGSNVVDSVVVSLRKKLGEWARLIKTISGTGYSYRPPTG